MALVIAAARFRRSANATSLKTNIVGPFGAHIVVSDRCPAFRASEEIGTLLDDGSPTLISS
jgi:hypothetical protein